MANPDLGNAGRLYRVGKHWYLDTALLQGIARRMTVEPMQGGYQILAPGGLLRCMPASGLPLPGQTGDLFRCQGQSPEQDVGARLRKLAGAHGVMGGEWDQWPGGAAAPTTPCGCTSCAAGGACPCGAGPHAHAHDDDAEPQTFLERLIVSETLGTVFPRMVSKDALALYPAQHAAPEWVAGRYHECIASILRFPDLASNDWIVLLDVRTTTIWPTWGVTLDRQRTGMLGEILQLVARLADRTKRKGSVRPSAPSKQTPGAGAWEMAAALAEDFHRANPHSSLCMRCPYHLGTNLRCPACRDWQLARKPSPAGSQEPLMIKLLTEQKELRSLRPAILRTLAQAIIASLWNNPHEPLTDRFFVQFERDLLVAGAGQSLHIPEMESFLEFAELSPFEPQIAVGTHPEAVGSKVRRSIREHGSCESCGTALTSLGAHGIGCPRCADDEMNAMDAEHHP